MKTCLLCAGVLCGLLLGACANPPDDRASASSATSTPRATQATPPPMPSPGVVTEADLGARWPLTVPSVTLRCENDGPRKYVTATTQSKPGIQYAVNGSARGFGYPAITTIQKPGGIPYDLQPLIDRGLPLCGK